MIKLSKLSNLHEGSIQLTSDERNQVEEMLPEILKIIQGSRVEKYTAIDSIKYKLADGTAASCDIYVGNDQPGAMAYYQTQELNDHTDNYIVIQQQPFKVYFGFLNALRTTATGDKNPGIELLRQALKHELIHAKDPATNHHYLKEPYDMKSDKVYYKSWKEFQTMTGQFFEAITTGVERIMNDNPSADDIRKIEHALKNILKFYAGKTAVLDIVTADFIQDTGKRNIFQTLIKIADVFYEALVNTLGISTVTRNVLDTYVAYINGIKIYNPSGYKEFLKDLYKTIDQAKDNVNKILDDKRKSGDNSVPANIKITEMKHKRLYERFKLANLLKEEKSKEELAAELKKAFDGGLQSTLNFLNSPDGKSDIVRNDILLNPQTDGAMSDDVVDVKTASGLAMDYKPTQSEIDLMKSVSWPLGSAKNLIQAIRTGPTAMGIVTSGDLIIDGHHRWSGAISIGGNNAKISGKDVDWPGKDTKEKLAAAQIAIAATIGPGKKIPSQAKSFKTNIMGKSSTEIANMIMSNVNKQTDANAPGALLNDKMIKDLVANEVSGADIVYDWLGGKPFENDSKNKGYKLRLAIANKVAENLKNLPDNPDAPPRKDMPQFDPSVEGPKIDDVIPKLSGKNTGDINMAPPYKTESVNKKLDSMLNKTIIKIK